MGNPGIGNKSRQEVELQILRPALLNAGWENEQILYRRRFSMGMTFTKIDSEPSLTFVEPKHPTFTLCYWPNYPLAIIRHAEKGESLSTAIQNALPWAQAENGGLDVILVYSTDGYKFLELDTTTGHQRSLELALFPSPRHMWSYYLHIRGFTFPQSQKLLNSCHAFDGRIPKYFEHITLNRIIEAMLKGEKQMAVINGAPGSIHFVIALLIRHLWEQRLARRFLYLIEKNPAREPGILRYFKGFNHNLLTASQPLTEQEYPCLHCSISPGGTATKASVIRLRFF